MGARYSALNFVFCLGAAASIAGASPNGGANACAGTDPDKVALRRAYSVDCRQAVAIQWRDLGTKTEAMPLISMNFSGIDPSLDVCSYQRLSLTEQAARFYLSGEGRHDDGCLRIHRLWSIFTLRRGLLNPGRVRESVNQAIVRPLAAERVHCMLAGFVPPPDGDSLLDRILKGLAAGAGMHPDGAPQEAGDGASAAYQMKMAHDACRHEIIRDNTFKCAREISLSLLTALPENLRRYANSERTREEVERQLKNEKGGSCPAIPVDEGNSSFTEAPHGDQRAAAESAKKLHETPGTHSNTKTAGAAH